MTCSDIWHLEFSICRPLLHSRRYANSASLLDIKSLTFFQIGSTGPSGVSSSLGRLLVIINNRVSDDFAQLINFTAVRHVLKSHSFLQSLESSGSVGSFA